MKQESLLIEIGTEELPRDAMDLFLGTGAETFNNLLKKERLNAGEVTLFLTPRRIILSVASIADRQSAQKVTLQGPAWKAAFDDQGNPSKALDGFLRSKQLSQKDIVKISTDRGDYVSATVALPAQSLAKVLQTLLNQFLTELPFGRRMRWDQSGFAFPRPIRWLVAIHGKKNLAIQLAGIKSAPVTTGHRFLGKKKIKVNSSSISSFRTLLAREHVMIDQVEREAKIRKGLLEKASMRKPDLSLLQLTAQLCEEPFVMKGTFDRDFLKLPAEILVTSMKKHQKLFAVSASGNKLKAEFVAVLNGRRKSLVKIEKDFREVLEARLRDARFFLEEDAKTTLEAFASRLNEITFLGKLGTLADKQKRMMCLATWIANVTGKDAEFSKQLSESCALCKADLLTQMVFEFPELQGTVGRIYAEREGRDKQVCRAIEEHYDPKHLGVSYKELSKNLSETGALTALIDKIDILVGAFGIGLEPTGSQDPYALRRQAGGIVKILRAFPFKLSLGTLIEQSIESYQGLLDGEPAKIQMALKNFLFDRTQFELSIQPASLEDQVLKAVMASGSDDLRSVFERFSSFSKIAEQMPEAFAQVSKILERTRKISKGHQNALLGVTINPDLFAFEEESKVYRALQEVRAQILELKDGEQFANMTQLFADTFFSLVDEYFVKVLVNDPDKAVKMNRLAMLNELGALYADKTADLSLLQGLKSD